MKLFKTGIDLGSEMIEFANSANSLFIYTPYIKLDALKEVLDNSPNCKAIIVRWETRDFVTGASDLDIYPYCKEKGISLFRNSRLHLKALVDNYKTCFLGSANISARALDVPKSHNYNYELATVVDNLTLEDRLYFSIIEQGSTLITDNIYQQFADQIPRIKQQFPNEDDFNIKIESPDKDFLISSLPLTYNVDTLFRIYESKNFINDVELNCATHDLALYRLPFDLPLDEFRTELKRNFFEHPFIKAFLENMNIKGETYFGEAKAWIHAHCSNVPLPRRWEITENIQILYQWIEKLSDGKYVVDRPSYSERLKRVK